ncbi:MAG: hypothetical protein RBU37_16210, partial [Myxococcota bacterium]|nr:hypothetical protein [Myxococcota bacterium]
MHEKIAPGAQIQVRDAVWRVLQCDLSSSGMRVWTAVGLSEIVRDQEAVFLEELEPDIKVLDPRESLLVDDPSPQHRATRAYLEAALRELAPPYCSHSFASASRASLTGLHSFASASPAQRCAGASDAPATDADSCLASLTGLHSFASASPSQR